MPLTTVRRAATLGRGKADALRRGAKDPAAEQHRHRGEQKRHAENVGDGMGDVGVSLADILQAQKRHDRGRH